jgi:hypothetical protein
MTQLLIQYGHREEAASCPLCRTTFEQAAGPRLVLEVGLRPVCPGCAKRQAPALVALVRLADEAARVGRIGRHTVFPPYTALLDLARAADVYAAITPPTEAG